MPVQSGSESGSESGESGSEYTDATTSEDDSDVEIVDELPNPEDDVDTALPELPIDLCTWSTHIIEERLDLLAKPKITVGQYLDVYKFLSDPEQVAFFIWTDTESGAVICSSTPPKTLIPELAYFIKAQAQTIYPWQDFDNLVQHGTVRGDYLNSIYDNMGNVFSPLLSGNKFGWPVSVRNEFASGMNRFMSTLTETFYLRKHQTVLYVPNEDLDSEPLEELVRDRELVQRVETTLIHWTRKIKDVLHSLTSQNVTMPLEEIRFWEQRCEDLSGIGEQLQRKAVQNIVEFLISANSPYVRTFQSWAMQITDGLAQAKSNLKFLKVLKEPCESLNAMAPSEFSTVLPEIVDLIRLIQLHSDYYNGREVITGMYHKVSHAVIMTCCKHIDLDAVFQDDLTKGRTKLMECIESCDTWKAVYAERSAAQRQGMPDTQWNVNHDSVFAQVDAFIHRCRDLLDVCTCVSHFCAKEGTVQKEITSLTGTNCARVVRSMEGIRTKFHVVLAALRIDAGTNALHGPKWKEAYNTFKLSVRELEVLIQGIIGAAFKNVHQIMDGMDILTVFSPFNGRDLVRRTLSKCTKKLYNMLTERVARIKQIFNDNRTNPDVRSMSPEWPKHAGAACWARCLQNEVEDLINQFTTYKAYLIENAADGSELVAADELKTGLSEFCLKTYNSWYGSVGADLNQRLSMNPLMRRESARVLLELNFDKQVLATYQEISLFHRIGFEIPPAAADAYSKREDMRLLREHVLLVLRDYNRIIMMLTPEERDLFRERIRFLDKKIQPGLTKLTWTARGIKDSYVADSRKHSSNLREKVEEYLTTNREIAKACHEMSNCNLLEITPRKTYKSGEFESDQADAREKGIRKLKGIHNQIVKLMKRTYQVFKNDGIDVQQHWARYTMKIDKMVETSLKVCVKRSLVLLTQVVNGDGKTEPHPTFRMNVVLDKDSVHLEPRFDKLKATLIDLGQTLASVSAELPRLPSLLARNVRPRQSYRDVIDADEECIKLLFSVRQGLISADPNLESYIQKWVDEYSHIWMVKKDPFIKRYASADPPPPLYKFDADISRYDEIANNTEKHESMVPIDFLQLDNTPIKFSIVEHCALWRQKFTTLLYDRAVNDMNELRNMLADTTAKLKLVPETLDEMVDTIVLLDGTRDSLDVTAKRFEPITEQFEILYKHEVEVDEKHSQEHDGMPAEWEAFKEFLVSCAEQLEDTRKTFKNGLLKDTEDLSRKVEGLRSGFLDDGPFSGDVPAEDAVQALADYHKNLQDLRATQANLTTGLKVFGIAQAPYKEMEQMDEDLGFLDQLWGVASEFNTKYAEWKITNFKNIKTEELEEEAGSRLKKLVKLQRQVKEKEWDMIQHYRQKLNTFKNVMPLILNLKEPAMRDRHWKRLMGEVGKTFDPYGEDFTLGSMIELQLDSFSEQVAEISGAAAQELKIELKIAEIAEMWVSAPTATLEIGEYKTGTGHFLLQSTDDVFAALEDNQVTLATMKASRFVKVFAKDVDKWERALSLILEVIESILTVQRQWMYLENIFTGEDIRKQLPNETRMFDDINDNWKEIMTVASKDPNAHRATHREGLLKRLNGMNDTLERIQKALDRYLETKRQLFPRFYFVSNDDLLEILGQSRNPQAVQVHLLKCFDNVKALELRAPANKNRAMEADAMFSSDKEMVPFDKPVVLDGAVENWLTKIELEMRRTLRIQMNQCKHAHKKTKRDKWIKDWPGQLIIAVSQLGWTADTSKAITGGGKKVKVNPKKGLKSMRKKQVSFLKKLTEAVRKTETKLMKKKLVALITIEVHSRDVLEKLMKVPSISIDAFEWLSQLRYSWEKTELMPDGDTIVRQTNTMFTYGYEYLGNSGRLVITPLTDRCYMTLTSALHMTRGGSPKGPAGTGKTETVKDLGKALGDYVIVVNCSEGLDYKSIGRMLSGLAQTGAWGCFDEFNRINIEVLSVVAQQVLCVLGQQEQLDPMKETCSFVFEGIEITMRWSCGLFITMNPGYAGRTELPDNLKSMFRPISMMVPDSGMIAEIMLMGEGFGTAKMLAKKVFSCYDLALMQLSKQFHYDFKLRALVSIIRNAGKKRAAAPDMAEEDIMVQAIKDMNNAKCTADDLPLFLAIVGDLFPGIDTPDTDYGELKDEVIADYIAQGLQPTDFMVIKTLQLYETKTSRHSVMIVGQAQSGKTTSYQTLQRAMISCEKKQLLGLPKVQTYPLNPRALSLAELYGEFNVQTNEWTDGVLSSVMRIICADEKPDQKWIVFDGPVDADWIESMNSVMDDNKLLTLINGERISMPEQVSLLFECQDLAVASPATVSRAGFVFYDINEMGWRPYVSSWLDKINDKDMVTRLNKLFEKFVDPTSEFIRKECKELVTCTVANKTITLCTLLQSLLIKNMPVFGMDKGEDYDKAINRWFLFCLLWSLGAAVDEAGRKKMDNFIREREGQFPPKDTVYEYYVDTKSNQWAHWETKLSNSWSFPATMPFYKILVPTVDTLRYDFILTTLLKMNQPSLVVGPVGTGKTQLTQSVLDKFNTDEWSFLNINMSSQTTSNNVQEIIEGVVEKRTKGTFVPIGGKKLMCFIDDMNMPAKMEYGDQPPLELYRQWMEYGIWYDREKQVVKSIQGMYTVAAMGPPGGGRTEISMRLQSRFSLLNMTFPTETTLKRIFGTIVGQRLQGFNETVKPLGEAVTAATLDVYGVIAATMLPTPAKIHYLFNLRDISKIFQGMYRANKDFHDTPESLQRLWVHECFRVFGDRLVGDADNEAFLLLLEKTLHARFDVSFGTLCPGKESPIFADFMKEGAATPIYEDVHNFDELKAVMDTKVEDYNETPGYVAIDLVLFRYCLEHITRITRVIALPRGNMMLIGVGGSGRQSVARLASSIQEYKIFMIEVTKTYRLADFREDLRRLYRQTGLENKPTTFLFNDTQVVDESMLEDINNVLSSGEVPNLFPAEDLEEINGDLSPIAKKAGVDVDVPGNLYKFLIERVRDNLHIVLAMSPVGEAFRSRLRMYPGLVNCTTIDYFTAWPGDALMAVAEKYMIDVDLDIKVAPAGEGEDGEAAATQIDEIEQEKEKAAFIDNLRLGISKTFATMHTSVIDESARMLEELKRHNYVTPINYLELVTGYKALLAEKRTELGEKADKLTNGLEKIDDTRIKVEAMGKELLVTQAEVAEFQKECDEYLVVIVQQKKEADDQAKAVGARREKIQAEAAATMELATAAKADLAEAMPALQAAMDALKTLNKGDITEIKSYGTPPKLVMLVMEAVQVLRKQKTDWPSAKKSLGESDFLKQLAEFDKDHISDNTRKKLQKFTTNPDFTPDAVGKVSGAGRSLCMWVRAMEIYGRVFKVVGPKRAALEEAERQLAAKQAALASAEAKLAEVTAQVKKLQDDFQQKLATKDELARKAEETSLKLSRAKQLVEGLAGERVRWAATIKVLRANIILLVGDCLLGAAFLSYMGPFVSAYRTRVMKGWVKCVEDAGIPHTRGFELSNFLARPTDVRFWNIQGLPSDQFSTENGVMVTRGRRWPLMIDPQGQAIKWIKNMEGKRGLKIVDLQMPDYLRTLENAIQYGTPVLMQNVGEELDPSLEPILNKSFIKVGGRLMLRLGDKEVEFNPAFKFYLTTKMSNPTYGPDISTKVTLVNFAVVLQGLEAQMLGIVVRRERKDLEDSKDELVLNIASGKAKLVELEDRILFLLANAKGSLLDDVTLIDTLNSSKITSTEVNEQLTVAETTEKEIDAAREGYRTAATRSAILFFVLNDIEKIDPMYQFSLDAYNALYNVSITKALKSSTLATRIENINDYHTYAVYASTCRGLFEKDKLLFSFHLNAKIFEAANKINMTEYNFFLRGGMVLDRSVQVPNPSPQWLMESAWDNITEMDKNVPKFSGLVNSFESENRDWYSWYTNPKPEATDLPGEWQNSCNELQRMLLVRALRPDRVAFVVTSFIQTNLGQRFTEPPALDMNAVLGDSAPHMPLIFVLSTGVDPTANLMNLAETKGMRKTMNSLSLGQGQAPIAEGMIEKARKAGEWVFLANCHLSLSWMPRLAKVVESFESDTPHKDFRLWLSSSPSPDFPISILQSGIKMTTEPPKGLKANFKRLITSISEEDYEKCTASHKYKKLVQSLAFFHSVLIERRKFQMLGWNVIYPFNDSDFWICEKLLRLYLDEYDNTPWDAMRYLISGVMYGGHVTDDSDRKLMLVYSSDVFREEALTDGFKLSYSDAYTIQPAMDRQSLIEHTSSLPNIDSPEAFGQHPNADISSMIRESTGLLGTLVSLQPAVTTGGGQSNEDRVLELAADMEEKVPEPIDLDGTKKMMKGDSSPLNVVLFQEIERYNALLKLIKSALIDLQKGIKGLVVMSSELEDTFQSIMDSIVPGSWKKVYPSQKPLAAWMRDLIDRIAMFQEWAVTHSPPKIFWMSAFSFPTGFLTALLQATARNNNIAIDSLAWEFVVQTIDDVNIAEAPKEGAYIKGLYLEGAGWDRKRSCLVESQPMQLVSNMPTILFKPVEVLKVKVKKGVYSCPCYYYPNRNGEGGASAWSFVLSVDIKSGDESSDHWIKRGAALLMSLET